MRMTRPAILASMILTMAACGEGEDQARIEAARPAGTNVSAQIALTVRTLEWEDLVPKEFRPDELLARYETEYDLSSLDDNDPRAQELMRKLTELSKQAPAVAELDGKTVRLPGFVVPLEDAGHGVEEFLLVPYYGACVQLPPPPVNQTVQVRTAGAGTHGLFDTVWVTGVVHVERTKSALAEAGYRIEATEVAPYE